MTSAAEREIELLRSTNNELRECIINLLEASGHLSPFGDGSIRSIRQAKKYLKAFEAAERAVLRDK